MGQKRELQVLIVACLFAAFTAYLASCVVEEWQSNSSWILLGILASFLCASFLVTLMCVDIWLLRPADSHTLETLISQYIDLTRLRILAPFVRSSFHKMTQEPALKTITDTLLRIIRSNQATEYGRRFKFSEINSIEDFTRLHPITTYEHYRSYIDRIMVGEKDILFPGDTCFLASTSGTTGGAKVYPFTHSYMKKGRFFLEDMIKINSLMPMMNMKRFFRFHLFSHLGRTSGGIPIGALSQVALCFPKHNLIPVEYQRLNKEDQSYYAMAVFALAEKELSRIDCFSADLMNAFMKFTVKHWANICYDIERGMIGGAVEMPEEIRASLSTQLKADSERAHYLRQVIKQGQVGLAKRAWPDLAFVTMAKSAGFKVLATKLIENHFEGVKVIGFMHGATEGFTGVNHEKNHRAGDTGEIFTFYPELCFVEFIPVESTNDENPKVLLLNQLEVGHCYEIVHTNENGLYRCRYGDVIKVVGYMNNIPKYEFVYRLGQRLNIAYERTPDTFLYEALQRAKSALNIKSDMTEFTTTESIVIEEITGESSKGHYVFFVEFGEKEVHVADLARKTDQNLVESYELYKRYRDLESIADIEIIQVKPGTMEEIKRIVMGAQVNPQFKMPRVLRKEPAIRYLLDNRM